MGIAFEVRDWKQRRRSISSRDVAAASDGNEPDERSRLIDNGQH